MSELWPQGTVLARLHLSLFHWSGSFTRVGFTFPTSSPHLAPVSAPVTVLLPNPQVCEWRPPEELKRLLDLELRDAGEPHHRLLQRCQDVIRYSVKTSKSSPRFICAADSSSIFVSTCLSHSRGLPGVSAVKNLPAVQEP